MVRCISDYLRDFPIRAKTFIGQERESKFFLTLNVILNRQKNRALLTQIGKVQGELENVLGAESKKDPYQDGLFSYPPETLHFSILSFYEAVPITKLGSVKDFYTFQEEINQNREENGRENYKTFKTSVRSFLKRKLNKLDKLYKADLRWLYTGKCPDYQQNAFSLQVYPDKDFLKIVDKLFQNAKKFYDTMNFNTNHLKFKGYPTEPKNDFFRFVANIGRFINQNDKITNEISTKAINYTEKFNRDDDKKPRINTSEIKELTLVESDPWLYNATNETHVIDRFPLK